MTKFDQRSSRNKLLKAPLLLSTALLGLVGCRSLQCNLPEDNPVAAPLLKSNPVNPRYFCDPEGNAVYLTGSHTWNNLVDKGPGVPPTAFDWEFYLNFLVEHNHNFVRLWSGQILHDQDPGGGSGVAQLPWKRTGPGLANDGRPKLDLTQFDPAYFTRLRHRVESAGKRGIYIDVMLFEGWCATVGNARNIEFHAFAGENNINGVDILSNPRENIYADWVSLDNPEVVRLQELYVRQVIECVNEFDNIIYEIANEPTGISHPWQEHFVKYIREVESGMPKQHMVGSPGGMKTSNRKMFTGGADWVSPDIQSFDDPYRERYKEGSVTWGEPDYDQGNKVVILDTDHLWGLGGDVAWAWKSFCRGYNIIYMDPGSDWPGAFFQSTKKWSAEPNKDLRREMGIIRSYAERIDLNKALPHNDLCSTGYCLAEAGVTYLAFQPEPEAFTMTIEPGKYWLEWYFPEGGTSTTSKELQVEKPVTEFQSPENSPAVLFLRRQS